MCFESVQVAIERDLGSRSAQRAFEHARTQHAEMRCYRTVASLLEVLMDRDPACQPEKELLMRALLRAAQQGPRPLFGKTVLVHVFLPSLRALRRRYPAPTQRPEDVDGLLWSSFFEVIAHYPLDRRRSMAAGLVLDTRKLYRKRLLAEEERARAFQEMCRALGQLPPELRASGDISETGPLLQLDAIDRREMRAALCRCPQLSPEDADLLWQTDVCGQRLLDYLRARGLDGADPAECERAHERLRRRKTRAKQRLYDFLKKNLGPICPISASERLTR